MEKYKAKASFFLTGRFYRNKNFSTLIQRIKQQGHYLGPHSDQHLLYCDWDKRDSLLVTKVEFRRDLGANIKAIEKHGVKRYSINFFIPPYEWYNDTITAWTKEMKMQLVNFSPGT
ncbi:MAG: cellulase, partial [Segetibacter sp.]|nr:cellulase [Segetibacter sp.]